MQALTSKFLSMEKEYLNKHIGFFKKKNEKQHSNVLNKD